MRQTAEHSAMRVRMDYPASTANVVAQRAAPHAPQDASPCKRTAITAEAVAGPVQGTSIVKTPNASPLTSRATPRPSQWARMVCPVALKWDGALVLPNSRFRYPLTRNRVHVSTKCGPARTIAPTATNSDARPYPRSPPSYRVSSTAEATPYEAPPNGLQRSTNAPSQGPGR